jgi:nucleotide-binding universal stress UspA family protein
MSTALTAPPVGAVVVGVGPRGSDAALSFAAEEACLALAPLHLVHVLQLSPAEGFAGVVQGAIEAADACLDAAMSRARELVSGQVPVTGERLDEAWLVADLAARSAHARLLVLQHRRQSRVARLVTGSTVAGVAARSSVPVVSIPEDWRGSAPTANVVTVGVQHPDESEAVVRLGIAEARLRGAEVVVLNAWYLEGGYDSVVADAEYRTERQRQVTEAIIPTLDALRDEHPDVPIRLLVRHALPLGALVEAGSTSRLLVVGRRHHRLPAGSHLGPVTRGLLQYADGPVLVSPELPRPAPRSDLMEPAEARLEDVHAGAPAGQSG